MVELQDDGIRLGTVHTGARSQVLDDEAPRASLPPPSRLARLVPVDVSPAPEVVAEAVATPPLAIVATPVEAGQELRGRLQSLERHCLRDLEENLEALVHETRLT